MSPSFFLFPLSLITIVSSVDPFFSCHSIVSDWSGSNDDDYAEATCGDNDGCVLTSCGAITRSFDDALTNGGGTLRNNELDGTKIVGDSCRAYNGFGGYGVSAIATCCCFRDENAEPVFGECTSRLSERSGPADDARASVSCQDDELLLGCSPHSYWTYLDGSCYGNDSCSTLVQSQTAILSDQTCTAMNGAFNGNGIYANAQCCKIANPSYSLDCKIVYGTAQEPEEWSFDLEHSFAYCDDDYEMVGCTAYNPYQSIAGWFGSFGQCLAIGTTGGSTLTAIGNCCKMIQVSTTTTTPSPTVVFELVTCAVDDIACDEGASFEHGLCYSDCEDGYVADIGDDECTEDDCFFCDEHDRTITAPNYGSLLTTGLGISDGFQSFFDQTPYSDIITGFFGCFSDAINTVDWANVDGPISLSTELLLAIDDISFTDIKNCVVGLRQYLSDDSIVIAAELAPSYSLGTGFGTTYGVAFNVSFDNGGNVEDIGVYYYDGGCSFISTSPSIGIDLAFVAYRKLTDISGTAIVYGGDVPLLPFQPAIAINDACDIVAVGFSYDLGSVGIDLPISYEISGGYCFASDLYYLGSY